MIRLFRRYETPTTVLRLRGFQFPRAIIAYVVWSYHRVAMSTADIEDLVAERGVIVSREAIRLWVTRFGPHFVNCGRRVRLRYSRANATKRESSQAVYPNVDQSVRQAEGHDHRQAVQQVTPIKTLAPDADHCAHKGLNNAIDGSHRLTRKREREREDIRPV